MLLSLVWRAQAQGPFGQVYTVLQANCASAYCHSNSAKAGNLDLEGAGGNANAVYTALYNQLPANETARAKGHKLVYPGDPYRSFLFRKCNQGLDPDTQLDANEGADMPNGGQLNNKDKELIRQWILWGAKNTGDLIDTEVIRRYYDEGGINSTPERPGKPKVGEGQQIHMGPFFLAEGKEDEFRLKYHLDNPEPLELIKSSCYIGPGYSHHFIAYQFVKDANLYGEGLRREFEFKDDRVFVGAYQKVDSTVLPPKSAIPLAANTVLDLNSHYINASNKVLACHVYYNIHLQPAGIALVPMYTELVPNIAFVILGNNQPMTFNSNYTANGETRHFWMITSHTHSRGKAFEFTDRVTNKKIFSASHAGGNPDSTYIGYDYAHPPSRYFLPTYPVDMSTGKGLKMTATYQYNGAGVKTWGFTSEDEMMLGMVQYAYEPLTPEDVTEVAQPLANAQINAALLPNPVAGQARLRLNIADPQLLNKPLTLQWIDMNGRTLQTQNLPAATDPNNYFPIDTQNLPAGLYYYTVAIDGQPVANGKASVIK